MKSISISGVALSPRASKDQMLDIDGELKNCPAFAGEVMPRALRVIV